MSGFTFFDCEATGTDPADARVIQLAFLPEGGEPFVSLVNPGRPVPREVTDLTGIDDAAVRYAPPFHELADRVAALVAGRYLVGFNCLRYDVPLLAHEFERCVLDCPIDPAKVIDCDALFKQHHTRTLADAVRVYLGQEHVGAHQAEADARATMRVFHAQRAQFEKLTALTPDELAELSAYGKRPADPFGKLCRVGGRLCYAFGKYKGVAVADELGFAHWMLRADSPPFPRATLRVLEAELDRIEAARPREPESAGLFD